MVANLETCILCWVIDWTSVPGDAIYERHLLRGVLYERRRSDVRRDSLMRVMRHFLSSPRAVLRKRTLCGPMGHSLPIKCTRLPFCHAREKRRVDIPTQQNFFEQYIYIKGEL